MSDKGKSDPFDDAPTEQSTMHSREHTHLHGHHYKIQADEECEAVHRLRDKHRQHKSGESGKAPMPEKRAAEKQRPGKPPSGRKRKRRIIVWSQIVVVLFICITAGLTIRAIEMATNSSVGVTWVDELKQGNIALAAEKFSITASHAVANTFSSDLSTETLMQDFNEALPHLKQAGYTLTELEVELGIPPKLIPHFYHDPNVKLNLDRTLTALGDNSIGKALMHALAEAGNLQKELEVSDMKFSHIEVELGPIPSLKLQYKAQYVAGTAVRNSSRARQAP